MREEFVVDNSRIESTNIRRVTMYFSISLLTLLPSDTLVPYSHPEFDGSSVVHI